ncbi:hypothetical protein E4T42_01870 [Aureobasidium subglaciale]|nr:hypothetical protein E4T42_01870 [Aureobasidium subglaciale]
MSADSHHDKDEVDIIDIRSSTHDISLKRELEKCLAATPPQFPSLLLWDEKGLQHFEAITHSPEYYLTNCEIDLLEKHSTELATQIEPGSVILELGSGCLRKIKILLDALEAQTKPVDYYALDLSHSELLRTLKDISPSSFEYVRCHGLLGTYDDGLRWLNVVSERPKCIFSLGSTIGSYPVSQAAKFLNGFVKAVKDSTETTIFIVGVDGCKDSDRVWHAYNDRKGCNYRFIANVLHHANRLLGYYAFRPEDWRVQGTWDAEQGCHNQFLVLAHDLEIDGMKLKGGEGLYVVSSHKFDKAEQERLWEDAGLELQRCWTTDPHRYSLNALSSASISLDDMQHNCASHCYTCDGCGSATGDGKNDVRHLRSLPELVISSNKGYTSMSEPRERPLCSPTLSVPNDAVDKDKIFEISPPPYAEQSRSYSSSKLASGATMFLSRNVIWRIAFDWRLHRYIPKAQRPTDRDARLFKALCKDHGKLLSSWSKTGPNSKELEDARARVQRWIFDPCIAVDLLELFMFSVRYVTARTWYIFRIKRIMHNRSDLQLLRSVLDSQILVDILAGSSQTNFGIKLKERCAEVHGWYFHWLLPPNLIDTHRVVQCSPSSISSGTANLGEWSQAKLLLNECRRPCVELMNPALSSRYRVDRGYFLRDTKLNQQPGFAIMEELPHRNLLPDWVTLGTCTWANPDRHHNPRST